MTDPLTCLIAALWFEARQSYRQPDAILAIADVVQNRVADPRYPDDVCGVVFQRKQFSFTHDGLSDTPKPRDAIEKRAIIVVQDVAARSIAGERLGIGSNHYHTPAVSPAWADTMPLDGKIGGHLFYTWE